jgi:hypothetical protein
MRYCFASGMLFAGLFLVSCAPRNYNAGSEVKGTGDIASMKEGYPNAFNAFVLWRDGKGAPISVLPEGYDVYAGKIEPDDVFYVGHTAYLQSANVIGSVTEGAKVEGSVLTYPTKEGRALALKFSILTDTVANHPVAMQRCKDAGLRLPHVQELLDFCASGTAKDNDGRYRSNRCKGNDFWSASVYSNVPTNAWKFNGHSGYVDLENRGNDAGVWCVGGK